MGQTLPAQHATYRLNQFLNLADATRTALIWVNASAAKSPMGKIRRLALVKKPARPPEATGRKSPG
jgi:hypothetical protein